MMRRQVGSAVPYLDQVQRAVAVDPGVQLEPPAPGLGAGGRHQRLQRRQHLGPILGPIFVDLGVDPIHFAIIMSVNLTVGLATPPMGLVLFVASSVSGERVETISKAILPFLFIEIVVIFLITFIPEISMTIPRLTGFAD